ncbi:MAG: DM13 domain-containing protein [Solirubrobacterales bacterium]|nr:DM13 domain-containing protein [Solirubrobacterales bacterium]
MTEPRKDTSSLIRKLALPIAVLVIGLPVGIGVMMAMGKAPEDKNPVFTRVVGDTRKFAPEAQPRWEPVKMAMGASSAETSFEIAPDASQWKATWRCDAGGRVKIVDSRPGKDDETLVDTACPRKGVQTETSVGAHTLRVTATGQWRVSIEQQVHDALEEPPLAGMTADRLVARGRFYSIQRKARGTVAMYRLANGRLALRFEQFYTTGSPGLDVWLSRAKRPTSTLQSRDAPHTNAGALRSTLGTYNQVLPAEVSAGGVNSIIIWCPTVTIAFGAAALEEV